MLFRSVIVLDTTNVFDAPSYLLFSIGYEDTFKDHLWVFHDDELKLKISFKEIKEMIMTGLETPVVPEIRYEG